MPRTPERSPSSGPAAVLLVDDWAATFHVPVGAENRFEPGPRWLVPVASALGLLLAAAVLRRTSTPALVWCAASVVFGAGVVGMSLTVGGSRRSVAAMGLTTTAWVVLAAAVLGGDHLDHRVVAALLVAGTAGQVVTGERLRERVLRHRASVLAARSGTRSDGWVVGARGPAWATELRLQPSNASDGAFDGALDGWTSVRPAVGHPVGIWHGGGRSPVVLLPRTPG